MCLEVVFSDCFQKAAAVSVSFGVGPFGVSCIEISQVIEVVVAVDFGVSILEDA